MPTRFHFTSAERPNIAPVFSGSWGATANAGRFVMKPAKDSVAPTVGTTITIAAGAGSTSLDRQYISAGLNGAQVISGRVSGQLMVRELINTDNVDRALLNAKVVSNNGLVTRGVLLQQANYGPTLEFTNNASCRNKSLISGSATVNVNPVTGLDGDRIVLEIGYQTSAGGTTPEAAALWGGGAFSSPDLPIDETQTTAAAGWFEFGSVNLKLRSTQFIEISDEETLI